MTIKGQDYKLKYTLRALFIYEQITGKAFELKTITDEYLFFYCILMANNPDSSLTFEELIEAVDEDMGIMVEFQNFLKKELEKQQLYTDIEQTLLSLRAGYMEHQQVLQQLEAEALVLKESERKWEEGLISVFQLMEARNRFISAKAELVRVRLQVEMMRKLEKYYREGTFL